MNLRRLALQLEHRREELGMSCATAAHRAGLGLRTVQRALSGDETPEFATVQAIAAALGASIRVELEGPDVDVVRRQQAERKAERLVAMTQGTSALEAQAIPDKALARLKDQTAMQLLCGSSRRLWAE